MPPKKVDKNKDEKNKNENNKDNKEKKDKKKVPDKNRKVGEGVTVGIVDKPNKCIPETSKQLECPTRSIPSTSCPPPNCCEIQNYYPEEPQDCSTIPSCNPKSR